MFKKQLSATSVLQDWKLLNTFRLTLTGKLTENSLVNFPVKSSKSFQHCGESNNYQSSFLLNNYTVFSRVNVFDLI